VRTAIIGGKEIQLRANPLALLFYKQAFDSDLIADLLKLQSLQSLQEGDFSSLDTISLLQIAYAMNKAAKPADIFPKFEEWLAQFETIGFSDPQWIIDVVEEATDGFFRSGKSAPESKEQ
jgi:hypothetical protein